ncbi:hypothetical protein ABVT39_024831 [Epinephelus coioides]
MAASTVVLLTPLHGCDGCLQKSQAIAELERHISDLYWIRNEEKLLDSVITLGAGPPVNIAELDSTIPATDNALLALASVAPASVSQLASSFVDTPASTGLAASAPLSHLQRDDHWLFLGAKPKLVSAAVLDFTPNPRCRVHSSTPRHEPWPVAFGKKACTTSPQPICELQLSNRYDLLSMDDSPPLTAKLEPGAVPRQATPAGVYISAAGAGSPIPVAPASVSATGVPAAVSVPVASEHSGPGRSASRSAGSAARRKLLRNAVRWHSLGSPPRHAASKPYHPESNRPSSDRSKAQPAPPRPFFPTTTLIVGDSIIRQVHFLQNSHSLPPRIYCACHLK